MGEMEMWQRCLWALRFEVEPSIANDVEKHVTEKITALTAERDAFEHDYTAVGERNAELHAMYMQQAGEVEGLRAALDSAVAMLREAYVYLPAGQALDPDGTWWACVFCDSSASTTQAIPHTPECLIARIDAALAATTDTKETTDGH